MKNYYRNSCIALVGSMAAVGANAADTSMAAAAAAALDNAQSDVTITAPKVMMVVATVVGAGILIGLMRKA
ncbi:major coat protein [Aeromonas caviae]|uniref:major coat protein n=1 Tax=Aeromonas caviae TaxID=648 RepID=UPI002B4649B9|nr:major coat protein [Aeromonas caviae]